jgi:hypothetical protein
MELSHGWPFFGCNTYHCYSGIRVNKSLAKTRQLIARVEKKKERMWFGIKEDCIKSYIWCPFNDNWQSL